MYIRFEVFVPTESYNAKFHSSVDEDLWCDSILDVQGTISLKNTVSHPKRTDASESDKMSLCR